MDIIIDGVLKTVPNPPFDLSAAKTAKATALKQRAAEALMLYKPTLTGPAAGLPLAGHVIQTGRIEDQVRLGQSKDIYKDEIEALNGAIVGARFRTLANLDVMLTYQAGYDVLVKGVGGWGKRITHRAWDLTNQIMAATTKTALDAIDVEAGWPTE